MFHAVEHLIQFALYRAIYSLRADDNLTLISTGANQSLISSARRLSNIQINFL